jgi:hypothetical protein
MLYPWRCLVSIEDVAEDERAGLRAIHQQWLEFEEQEFQRTGNPVYAWGAYRTARAARLPVPDWVLGYLDGAADMLARLALEPPANVAPAVAEALGFVAKGQKGRGSRRCGRIAARHMRGIPRTFFV